MKRIGVVVLVLASAVAWLVAYDATGSNSCDYYDDQFECPGRHIDAITTYVIAVTLTLITALLAKRLKGKQ